MFSGLELNHIPRWLNKAADTLAKAASGRELVPADVFANDQHKPSVHYEEPEQAGNDQPILSSGSDPSLAPSEPKVMEIDEDPVAEPNPLSD